MRAVLFEQFGGQPVVAQVPDPVCPPAGVVIEVRSTGLCRSDWHGWMGHDDGIDLPHVPGHELAGVVAEVGPSVTGWQVGQRVTVPFVCACGDCATCRRGDGQVCERQSQPGFTHWGSFAELVAIDRAEVNLVLLPDQMPFDVAASLGCRFATAYRAVAQLGRPEPDDWLAVHGCGGVGLSAVMIAAAHGARVVAVDISPDALDLARDAGAAETILATERTDVPATIMEITAGGARVSIDALGSLQTCQNSILSLGTRGRHIQVGLMLGHEQQPPIPMTRVISHELQLFGTHGLAAQSYPALLSEIEAGVLAPHKLIARSIDLAQACDALMRTGQQPGAGITMIHP
ncbi:MAG: zinc-dependent alcohol dehydrogenase family protein [Dermatophilaceae bacterium]